MILEFEDSDEYVYTIDNFEVVFEHDTQFICNDDGIFIIDKLSDFKEHEGNYYLTDDELVLELNEEHYGLVKELFITKGRPLN